MHVVKELESRKRDWNSVLWCTRFLLFSLVFELLKMLIELGLLLNQFMQTCTLQCHGLTGRKLQNFLHTLALIFVKIQISFDIHSL